MEEESRERESRRNTEEKPWVSTFAKWGWVLVCPDLEASAEPTARETQVLFFVLTPPDTATRLSQEVTLGQPPSTHTSEIKNEGALRSGGGRSSPKLQLHLLYCALASSSASLSHDTTLNSFPPLVQHTRHCPQKKQGEQTIQ